MLEGLAVEASRELGIPLTAGDIRTEIIKALGDGTSFVRHPLGFAYRRLFEGLDGGYMRLHIWPVGSAVKVGSLLPHTHSSHLWSFVLLGGIENLVWVPAEGDDSHRLSAASIVHRRGGRSSVAEGEVSLRLADRSEHSTGSCYFVPQGTFHASCTPPRTFCATVVLRGAKTHTAVVAGLSDLGRHPDRLETRLTDFERSLLNEIDWMLLHKGQRGAFDENDREAELSASVTRRTERPVP